MPFFCESPDNYFIVISFRTPSSGVMDTKCPPTSVGCWFCQDACISCMKPSTHAFTSTTSDGLDLQFCSQKCADCFSGPDLPLQVSARLTRPLSAFEACEPIISVSAFARGDNKGTKFSFQIYPSEAADGPPQYCAHYQVRQLYSQQFCKLVISSGAVPLKQLDCTNPQAFSSSSSYWIVEQHLLEATKILLKCHAEFVKVNPSSESMTVYLDCSEQLISKLILSASSVNIVQELSSVIASYRIVSKVNKEWAGKQIATLLLYIDTFKSKIDSEAICFESVFKSLLMLEIELIEGMCCSLFGKVRLVIKVWVCVLAKQSIYECITHEDSII